MARYETHKLGRLAALYPTLAAIALDAVKKPEDEALRALDGYARRGMDCVLAFDGAEVVGYTLYGPTEKFFAWTHQMPLLIRLRQEGIGEIYTACHVHLRRKYWKTGTQLGMSRAFCAEILSRGVTHLLLFGYATDQLAAYSLKQPGGRALDGLLDSNGRQVGIRDLAAYLAGTK